MGKDLLVLVLSSSPPHPPPPFRSPCSRVRYRSDKDGDGVLTFPEFVSSLSVTARGTVEEKLDWAFELYDIDSDGEISFDEMVKIVESIYDMVRG